MPLAWSNLLNSSNACLPFGLGLVGDVDAGLDAPEQVGADGDEAQVRYPGGDVAHRLVHAEDLLDQHDDAGGFGFRLEQIGREAAGTVGGRMVMSGMAVLPDAT